VKLYATTNYRKNELGVAVFGANSDTTSITIPPGAKDYSLEYRCIQDCANVNIIDFE
jgi:hypothetical protein